MTQDPMQNYAHFVGSLRDYTSWLTEAGAEAMDIDIVVERDGHFLFMETKTGNSRFRIKMGEYLTYRSLSRHEGFYVIFVQEPEANVLQAVSLRAHLFDPHEEFDPKGFDTGYWAHTTKRYLAGSVKRWLDMRGVGAPRLE